MEGLGRELERWVSFGCGKFEIHGGNLADLAGNIKLLELGRLCSRKKKGGAGTGKRGMGRRGGDKVVASLVQRPMEALFAMPEVSGEECRPARVRGPAAAGAGCCRGRGAAAACTGAWRGDGQCWITGCGGSLHGAVRREGRGVAAATGRRRARRAAPASGHQGPGVSPLPGAARGRRAEDLHAETWRRTPVATAGARARWRGRIKQEKKEL